MILVTGAAGKTGKAVIKALNKKGAAVRAFVRKVDQKKEVENIGADEVIVGNMENIKDYQKAISGTRAVYHICPNMHPDETQIGQNAIESALNANVEVFGYHSVLHPQTEKMPHHWQKMRVEEMLFEAGMPYTILQPATYMQNILGAKSSILNHGIYRVPYPIETRLSMVDLEDLGEVAAAILTDDIYSYAIYELVGVNSISPSEVAKEVGEQVKSPVKVESISLQEWEDQAIESGLGSYQKDTLKQMFDYYAKYWFVGNKNVLTWLLGRAPTTFSTFTKREFMNQ